MTKVIALFENQEEATTAVDALTEAGLESADISVYESTPQEKKSDTVAPSPTRAWAWQPRPSTASQPASTNMTPTDPVEDLDLGEEEEEFLRRNVDGGGVLVVVDCEDDETADRAESVLEEQDGQLVDTVSD